VADYYTLPGYRALLDRVRAEGWSLRGLADLAYSGGRDLYIRHDIDAELYLLDPFLDVEESAGATATYFLMPESTFYNLHSPEGRSIISRIRDGGHAFGLHFFGEVHSALSPDQLAHEIFRQAESLESSVGAPVGVFSFHQPTRSMLGLDLEVPGLVNTYHEATMRDLSYVSDTNMVWQPAPPDEVMASGTSRVQMLVHPLWWIMDGATPAARWRQVVQGLSATHARHLLKRERALAGLDEAHLT